MEVVPNPAVTLSPEAEIVLIGTAEAEDCFLATYMDGRAAGE